MLGCSEVRLSLGVQCMPLLVVGAYVVQHGLCLWHELHVAVEEGQRDNLKESNLQMPMAHHGMARYDRKYCI